MKTEDLIRALTADGARPTVPIGRTLFIGLTVGAVLSTGLFAGALHARADLAQAIHTPAFVFKLIIAASLAITAATLLSQTARPLPSLQRNAVLLLTPALLVGGVIVELFQWPVQTWLPRLVGHNALHCVSLIPPLSLPTAACLFVGLRRGAPGRAAMAGAMAGLISGGLGAVLYALTCPDDSPLFIGTWYSIAILLVTGTSAWIGSRLLRW